MLPPYLTISCCGCHGHHTRPQPMAVWPSLSALPLSTRPSSVMPPSCTHPHGQTSHHTNSIYPQSLTPSSSSWRICHPTPPPTCASGAPHPPVSAHTATMHWGMLVTQCPDTPTTTPCSWATSMRDANSPHTPGDGGTSRQQWRDCPSPTSTPESEAAP